MSKPVDAASSRLYSIFAGLCVDIIVRSVRAKINGIATNMVVSGYFLDECEDFYYVGANPNEINGAIKKPDVVTMTLARDEGSMMHMELETDGDMQ